MESNKSIDGLSTRRSKQSSSSTTSATKTTTSTKTTPRSSTTRKTATRTAAKSSSAQTSVKASVKTSVKTSARATTKSTSKPKTAKPPVKSKTAKPTTINLTKSTKTTKTTSPSSTQSIPTSQPITSPQLTTPQPTSPQPTQVQTPQSTPTPQSTAEDFLQPTQVFNFDEQTGELKASDTPIHTEAAIYNPKKAKKTVSKKRKIITSIILAIVLLIIGAVIWFIIWGNDIIAKITGGQGNIFDLLTFTEPTYEPLKTDENGRTNILAFGTSGYNMQGDEGNGTHDGAQLTDSIMVISLNQETGDIAMLSLPRDLKASPTCTATGKINEVYWCNNMDETDEKAGAEALMTEVGDILGIDFQYYAHLNWGSLVQIVDTLGGITVTLDENIEDYYYTGIVFEAGKPYTISGIEAVALARARHGTTSGDFSRGASQQKILIGIKDKIFEKSLSLTDIIGLASALGDNLRTNFNVEELKSLAHLASEFDFNSMRQVSLIEPEMLMTTDTINGISYVIPAGGAGYYTRIQNYIDKMFSNNPSVYEDASILVLNGTETPGLAATEQKSLEDEGYANITIDDAPEGEYADQYSLYVLDDTTPATQKLLESKYSTTSKSFDELPPEISRDYNFVLILGGSPDESN